MTRTLQLGANGPAVSSLGLGCFGMSGGYGPADDAESIATIHAALESGINVLDTGDFYGAGHNELLIRKALEGGRRSKAFLCVKFGSLRTPDRKYLGDDVRPAAVKNFLAYSLTRLGTDYVDLYMPTRVDPEVPIEDTIGAISDMVCAGYVRFVGLSEASSETLRRAIAVHPISAMQIEYSLLFRGIETAILPKMRELGVALMAYGVLGRGLLSNTARRSAGVGEARARQPRFSPENIERNLALVERLQPIASRKGISISQLALAWVCHQGPDIVALVGARRRDQLTEAILAPDIRLSAQDLAEIEAIVPRGAVAGARYNAQMLEHLDSERDDV